MFISSMYITKQKELFYSIKINKDYLFKFEKSNRMLFRQTYYCFYEKNGIIYSDYHIVIINCINNLLLEENDVIASMNNLRIIEDDYSELNDIQDINEIKQETTINIKQNNNTTQQLTPKLQEYTNERVINKETNNDYKEETITNKELI